MFEKDVYISRRNRLQTKVKSGLILIPGNVDSPMNYPANSFHFRQDSTFLYFFGIDLQGLAGVIDVDNNRHVLFGDEYTLDDIIWMGPQSSLNSKAASVGVAEVLPFAKLSDFIGDAIHKGRKVHFTPPYRGENIMLLSDLLGVNHRLVNDYVSTELVMACIELRSIKEPVEIQELERHMDVAYRMYSTAMRMAHPGISEQEIAGIIEGISMSGGGMMSFQVICSVHGETLHNHYYNNILKANDLLLIDAGSESPLHYATDNTRTIPVGGFFTQKQKDIYQIVLTANNAAREATKPGVLYRDVHFVAAHTIVNGLKNLGLMKGDVETAVQEGAHALFFPHGIGHMLGLDVHDMEDYNDTLVGYDSEITRSKQFGLSALRLGRKLKPGFVVTDEPGIYFIPALIDSWKSEKKFEHFINYNEVDKYRGFGGIRLEDDILVTETGSRILGKRIPVTIDEVESEVNKPKDIC